MFVRWPATGDHARYNQGFSGRFMVAGQYPTREWRDNPEGQIRTIDEAWDVADRMVDKMRGASSQ
jgi:hypothetical protein